MSQNKTPNAVHAEGLLLNQSGEKILRANCTAREWAAVEVLRLRPHMREELDRAIGASNSPHIVMQLRRKGFAIHCEPVKRIDRYGHTCTPGRYSLIAEPGRGNVEGE